ncbi:MAG: FtsQ-type POTRA domain-containing protein [Tissierellaceae bacterium]|nr:FtsQ-type POTRA domain-containing protein [Tissierellaceae bacterium]
MKKLTRVEKKRKRRKFLFRIFLLCIIALTIGIYAINSDFFVIRDISVYGNNKLTNEEIIFATPINIGENIFRVSLKNAQANLVKLPYVKEVKIKRKYPKDIIVNISERKETAQIKKDFSIIVIDYEGYILDIRDYEDEKLPMFYGISIDGINITDNLNKIEGNKDNLEFIIESTDIGLLTKMDEIYMVDNNNINIVLNNGINVAFGPINNVEYKLKLLNEVIKDIEKKELSCKMILMDKGDNPIIVLKEE